MKRVGTAVSRCLAASGLEAGPPAACGCFHCTAPHGVGLQGPFDEPRPWAPRTISEEQVERVITRGSPVGYGEIVGALCHAAMIRVRRATWRGFRPPPRSRFRLSPLPLAVLQRPASARPSPDPAKAK